MVQQFSLVAYSIVIAVGVTQGFIIGKAIIARFPQLQFHTKFAAMLLFLLFLAYSIVSVLRFVYPDKINISKLSSITPDGFVTIILKIIGLKSDVGTVIAFSITVFVIILLKLTKLKGYRRSYILAVSIVMLAIMFIIKFSNYQPSAFETFLFILYHASMTGGLLWGAWGALHSRELRNRNFADWWIGKRKF